MIDSFFFHLRFRRIQIICLTFSPRNRVTYKYISNYSLLYQSVSVTCGQLSWADLTSSLSRVWRKFVPSPLRLTHVVVRYFMHTFLFPMASRASRASRIQWVNLTTCSSCGSYFARSKKCSLSLLKVESTTTLWLRVALIIIWWFHFSLSWWYLVTFLIFVLLYWRLE